MISRTFLVACMAAHAAAFMPGCTGPATAPSLRGTSSSAASRLTMVNEDRMDGFGGGKDAIKKVVDSRVKSDWGEQGTGGAKGQTYKGPSSFEEYLKKRAAEEGGKVTDLAGNDISEAKPTYEIAEGTWGPPEETKEESVFDWIDRASNTDTTGVMSEEQEEWKKKKEEERASEADEVETRMQKWLAEAAAKKAAGGQ